jgi:hypothetical protein
MITMRLDALITTVSTVLRKGLLPVILLAGGSVALAASDGLCQTPQHGPFDQISDQPRMIRAQIDLGAKLADEAVAILEATDDPEQLQRAKDLVKRSYVLLRYAFHGCELRKHHASVVENRFLTMAMDNIMAARSRNITADIAIGNSIPWPESRAQYTSEALDQLRPVSALAQRAAPLIR